jgi:hypothetical protein
VHGLCVAQKLAGPDVEREAAELQSKGILISSQRLPHGPSP